MPYRTNKDVTIYRSYSSLPKEVGRVVIPQGTSVEKIHGEYGYYFVTPTMFPAGSIERHDADYHGFRVNACDVEGYDGN
jgi:hypothetical protein